MSSNVIFLSFCIIATNLCHCAPTLSKATIHSNNRSGNCLLENRNNGTRPQEDPKAKLNELIIELQAGLRLVKFLPNEISQRKVTEAAIVLGQILTSGGAALQLVVENALQQVILDSEDLDFPRSVINKLLSYLDNLKRQISFKGDLFPQIFTDWLNRQIVAVKSTIQFNIDVINNFGKNYTSMNALVNDLESKVTSIRTFIQKGIELLLEQDSFQSNNELNSVRNGFKSKKYYQASARVVWNMLIVNQMDKNNEATSISFLTALSEVTKHEIPDLQSMPQAVLRDIRIFLKQLSTQDHAVFFAKLGRWNVVNTALESPLFSYSFSCS